MTACVTAPRGPDDDDDDDDRLVNILISQILKVTTAALVAMHEQLFLLRANGRDTGESLSEVELVMYPSN